jgi:hypothetical protein
MTTLREAAQQALEALEICVMAMQDYQAGIGITEMFDKGEQMGRKQIAALRAALAEQVAEDAKQMQRDLRDRIATAAMQGLLSNPQLKNQILKTGGADGLWIESSAYGWADGMLKEREKNRR